MKLSLDVAVLVKSKTVKQTISELQYPITQVEYTLQNQYYKINLIFKEGINNKYRTVNPRNNVFTLEDRNSFAAKKINRFTL